jgi:hypothetical protein
MKTFRQYIHERSLDEAVVRKGAVLTYAAQGRAHGDRATQHYRESKRLLTINMKGKDTDEKIDFIMNAIAQMADGMISTRQQIGSVSAQITASNVLGS